MTYKPTMADYQKAGEDLNRLRAPLMELSIWIRETFGQKYDLREPSHKSGGIDRVRSDLEDKMFRDFPDSGTDVFYGRGEE